MDAAAIAQQVFAQYAQLQGCVLPPLPETGRCGVCGESVAADAPQTLYTVPPTTIAVPILLCPAHATEA